PVHLKSAWMGLLVVALTITGLFLVVKSLRQKGGLYHFIQKKLPSAIPTIVELFDAKVSNAGMIRCLLSSLGVEFSVIFHVVIAMMALGLTGSIIVGAIAYIVSVLLMIASPFLRGLGAVELSMVYVLTLYGYSGEQA